MNAPAASREELVAEIRAVIARAGGKITFARFMELALYHPQLGYYRSGAKRVGKDGDFFTSVSVGPLFGKILARFFQKLRAEFDGDDFAVWEFGGRGGELRADVLGAAPDLKYHVIEVGEPLPETMNGCIFSNELLDALPVHRVRVAGGEWREVCVKISEQSFAEELGPLSDARLLGHLRALPREQMEGYRTEINLRALEWLEQIAARLRRGWVLTFDYGFEHADYLAPHRRDGHLQCYFRHTRNADPFQRVGEQDITAHVDFTELVEHGRALGLEPVRFVEQGRFLLDEGADVIREIVERDAGKMSQERSAVQQLIHPTHMGHAFRALLQRKLAERV
ncbi:MAG: class I SAM-dependent methyltransferase [Verrucomicrobia bacterium]|nr:MAG: class I SAM-dependent methyltransferase [Verrucomicrobiota bacterium]